MNPAHAHLLLNHVPVLGMIVGLLLLLASLVRRNHTLLRASYVAFIISAVAAVPVFLTGEPAEERVEGMPGVADTYIEQHEDAARFALAGAGIVGVLSIVAAFESVRRGRTSPALGAAILVASLATSGVMAWTANLGGMIRHTEIRTASVSGERSGAEVESDAGDDD